MSIGSHRTNGTRRSRPLAAVDRVGAVGSDEYLTPPALLEALGKFDLDPCSPEERPWPTARRHLSRTQDGLSARWKGRVFLNPPYGRHIWRWLAKLARHGDGIALTFARTETEAFHKYVWPCADAVLFLRGRLNFHLLDGSRCAKNAGAPSLLIAYGHGNALALLKAWENDIPGAFVRLTH